MSRVVNGRIKQLQKQINSKESNPVYTISELARQIRKDWKNPYFGAVPYIGAMMSINSTSDSYGDESAKSIINYFLANAGTWRGEEARRIKAILKKMVS